MSKIWKTKLSNELAIDLVLDKLTKKELFDSWEVLLLEDLNYEEPIKRITWQLVVHSLNSNKIFEIQYRAIKDDIKKFKNITIIKNIEIIPENQN